MQLLAAIVACGAVAAAAHSHGTCPLKNCALKSRLASAGPGFADGVRFFAEDAREACPFADDNEPEPSKKEYVKYMKALGKVAEMPPNERRAYAQRMQDKWLAESEEPVAKEPRVDVTKPGVEFVNSTTWRELRHANKFDFLITFYAPWCPHCKAFVTSQNAPLKALSASLEKAGGPKVVAFDAINDSPPISIDAVPAIYLFKKTGEAILFEKDQSQTEALMAFSLGLGNPKAAKASLIQKGTTPSWKCALENCVLKSPLAKSGPAFQDGVRFFAITSNGKDTRRGCPFADVDDGKEVTTEEYMKYMNGLDKVGDMNAEQRRAYALRMEEQWLNEDEPEVDIKKPVVDVTKPGVEAVNGTTWAQLRNANKFDFLIAFYAPWCPHCKAFITSENAPINALSASLEQADGPKVVTFDVIADEPPLTIDSVPMVYLFRRDGQAITFEGNPHDLDSLMTFTLDNALPKKHAKQALISKHLRA